MAHHYARRTVILAVVIAVVACSSTDAGDDDRNPTDEGQPPSSAPTTSSSTPSPAPQQQTPERVPRWKTLKGVLHVHSPWSHDACDGNGLGSGRVPNATCLAELRAAPCKAGLDFVALTDHPAHMNEATPEQNLLFDASKGDQLLFEPGAPTTTAPIGNLVTCPPANANDTSNRKVLFGFGYEGTHTLPLFFKKQPTKYEAYAGDRSVADVKALVADLKSAGAVVALAHSEESDLPANLVVEGGADAMEWYNPHGNFKTALGSGGTSDKLGGSALSLLSLLGKMDDFLAGSKANANADLVYLQLLPSWPKEGFEKWRLVQRSRYVPGVLGSDVHQNISVDPVCKDAMATVCAGAAGGKQGALAALVAGGQLMLNDGRRLDAYERVFRWLNNRVLAKETTPAAIGEAIQRGRSYGVFSVFGDPADFAFEGVVSNNKGESDKPLDMGDEEAITTSGGTITLTLRTPTAPTPLVGGAPFDAVAAKTAEIRALIFRTDASGTTEVAKSTTLGAPLAINISTPGAYHAEIWIKPKHLAGALGSSQASLAAAEYLWLITNPIRVTSK